MDPIMTAAEFERFSGRSGMPPDDIAAWIAVGQQAADDYTGRTLGYGAMAEKLVMRGSVALLHSYPVDDNEPVTVKVDGETVADDGYFLSHKDGLLYLDRASESDAVVEVEYHGGYKTAEVPAPIKVACAMIANAMLTKRDSGGQQILSEKLDGYAVAYVQQFGGTGLESVAPAAAALLRPYAHKAGVAV